MSYVHLTALFFIASIFVATNGLDDLIGTDIQQCINCLCHARTGCWSRINCTIYSVPITYWRSADSPRVDADSTESEDEAYASCSQDENCILNTINRYTEQFGERDCTADGTFNCKDRLAIHLFGANCTNPRFGPTYSRRFNECAGSIGVPVISTAETFGVPPAV